MNSALLSIRTDDKTKKEVTDFAASVGLSLSAFVTVVLKQAVREGRVVLSPTPELAQTMLQARADRKAGRNVTKTTSKDEALAHLRAL